MVHSEVKGMLDRLRVHPRESCGDVIGRLARRCYDPEPLSDEEIAGFEEALEDGKAGRIVSGEEIRRKYGVERTAIGSTTHRGPIRTWIYSRDLTPCAWSGRWRDPGGSSGARVEKLMTSGAGSAICSLHAGCVRVLLQILDDRLFVLVLEVRQRKTLYRDF